MSTLLLLNAIAYLAVFLRISVFMHLIPQIANSISQPIRIVVASSLALPALMFDTEDYSTPIIFLSEVIYGASLALPIALLFYLLPYAGRLIDTYRGAQFGELVLPGSGDKVTMLENIAGLISIFIFLSPVVSSQIFPRLVSPLVVQNIDSGEWISGIVYLFGDVLVLGFCLAAPIGISCFILDMAAAIVSKSAKRVNLVFELLSAKLLLGLLILLAVIFLGGQLGQFDRILSSGLERCLVSSSKLYGILSKGG